MMFIQVTYQYAKQSIPFLLFYSSFGITYTPNESAFYNFGIQYLYFILSFTSTVNSQSDCRWLKKSNSQTPHQLLLNINKNAFTVWYIPIIFLLIAVVVFLFFFQHFGFFIMLFNLFCLKWWIFYVSLLFRFLL